MLIVIIHYESDKYQQVLPEEIGINTREKVPSLRVSHRLRFDGFCSLNPLL